jgi:competence protein ComEA
VAAICLFAAAPAQKPAPSQPPQPEARVDINHATVEELMRAPGMTRIWAERIVRFRPYRAKNDLLDRGVVTSEVYERIKDWIVAHRDKQ